MLFRGATFDFSWPLTPFAAGISVLRPNYDLQYLRNSSGWETSATETTLARWRSSRGAPREMNRAHHTKETKGGRQAGRKCTKCVFCCFLQTKKLVAQRQTLTSNTAVLFRRCGVRFRPRSARSLPRPAEKTHNSSAGTRNRLSTSAGVDPVGSRHGPAVRADEGTTYRAKRLHDRHVAVRTKRMIRGFICCTQVKQPPSLLTLVPGPGEGRGPASREGAGASRCALERRNAGVGGSNIDGARSSGRDLLRCDNALHGLCTLTGIKPPPSSLFSLSLVHSFSLPTAKHPYPLLAPAGPVGS